MYKLLYFMLVSFLLDRSNAKSKPVEASLTTKWQNTPIIFEASEFMAEESNEMFWKFVDTVANFELYNSELLPQMQHAAAIKAATQSFGNDQLKLKLLKFALGLRMYSPKIEMFDQLAKQDSTSNCDLFFNIGGSITCHYKEVESFIKLNNKDDKQTLTFQSDHIFPGSSNEAPAVILYGDITSSKFKAAHDSMKQLAENGKCRYVLRHYQRVKSEKKAKLSGYGIELAIKSTEYKASDDSKVKDDSDASSSTDDQDIEIDGFDFAKLRHLHPNLSSQLTSFRNHLIDSTNEMQPMKVWQLQDLSFQAAARVLSAPPEEQIKLLLDVSQNFPLRVRSLVKQQVADELRREIKKNQQALAALELEPGDSLFLMNGMQIDFSETDMFELIDMLRTEGKLINGLKKLEIKGNDLQRLMKLNVKSDTEDKHILDFRDSSIIWVNDIENDEKYARWPANFHELLRPAFPGTLRRIRKNMFHLVIMINPESEEAKHLIETAEIFWANDVPIRIGFSFLVDDSDEIDGNDDAGVALVRAFNFARDELDDNSKSFSFLTGIYKTLEDDAVLTVDHIKARFKKKFKSTDIDDVIGSSSEYDENRKQAKQFLNKSGLSSSVNVLFNGELMSDGEIRSEDFEQSVVSKVMEGYPLLQRATYMGELTNDMNALDFLMERPNVVLRLNDRILRSPDRILDLLGNPAPDALKDVNQFAKLTSTDQTATLSHYLTDKYLSKSDQSKYVRPISIWLITDLSQSEGRNLYYNALKHVKASSLARVGIIHNPANAQDLTSLKIASAVEAALTTLSDNHARNFVTKLTKEENAVEIVSGKKSFSDFYVGGMDSDAFEKELKTNIDQIHSSIQSESMWASSVLRLKPGQSSVVANGKVFNSLNPGEILISDDFHLVEMLLQSSISSEVQEATKSIKIDPPAMSSLIMKVSSHLLSQPGSNTQRVGFSIPHGDHSVIRLSGSEGESSSYDIIVVLDPASDKAQEIVPIVKVLQEVLDANVRIYMNCREKLSDLPVKRFFRYVLEPEMHFKVDNTFSDGPVARFTDMPSKSILTLNFHPPEGWMVEALKAIYDLDNIKLEEVSSKVVFAEYELEHLVLEGHARDLTTGSPPRGLQFTLGRSRGEVSVDTIVMANLGYFQLKANPGVWYLNLREGRSRDIYQISSHENTEETANRDDAIVVMDSFKSKVIIVKVSKKPGKVDEPLLEEEDEEEPKKEAGLWDSLTSSFTGGADGGRSSSSENSTDVINIFSLASGHLYERLMRIMMLSVLSKTQTKVKFWVLKNYLSPQFKDFIPYMAEKYGFEYELVQYKWPRWLRQQVEKQRTMWGYKILFLDVLFPLDVDKIIFVDADQIVRADLKELRDLDLEGNPYGYTPFCDDRKEMDGFRFWKGGYWANHLAGRKYHISAIYVVDLKKFRLIAAGDRLRGQYQGLSHDPNSLSNLDQDLPNNMIHQVGIKSLPQEWLWCATWCSDESKARAKTIDLCNNPLTKEPKLKAAVRIAPEWTGFDEEVKALFEEFKKNKTSASADKHKPSEKADVKRKHQEL